MQRSAIPVMLLLVALGTPSHAHYPFPCSHEEKARAAAIARAVEAGDQAGLDALTKLLGDENARTRTAALLGIMRLSKAPLDFQAATAAAKGLTGADRNFLAAAAEATLILLDKGTPLEERRARLIEMTESKDDEADPRKWPGRDNRAAFRRRMGVEALRELGGDAVMPALQALANDPTGGFDDSFDMKPVARVAFDAWWGMRSKDLTEDERLHVLIEMLRLGDPFKSRWCDAACDLIEKEGEKAVPLLIPLARGADKRSKLWALRTLRQIGTEDAMTCVREVCIGHLDSEDQLTRQYAAYALSQVADVSLIAPLAKALAESPDPQVRERAAAAFGIIDDERAVAPLRAALADANEGVRTRAAAELAKKGLDDGEDILLASLGRREGSAGYIAAAAMASIRDRERLARRVAQLLRKQPGEEKLDERGRILLAETRNRILRELVRWDAEALRPMAPTLGPALPEYGGSGWAKKLLEKLRE
jgi:HEAT repeat protein